MSESTRIDTAHFNMVEQQIRPWNVLDDKVLELLKRVPRAPFVPDAYLNLAYSDTEIPLSDGQSMLEPRLVARMLQALELKDSDNVLEVGTGSGYFTALIASCAKQVHSIDINAELSAQAAKNLEALNIDNVSLEVADGLISTDEVFDSYDVIVFTGSINELTNELKQRFQTQLRTGGRWLLVTGCDPIMEVQLITRMDKNNWQQESLFETYVSCLQGSPQKQAFQF